MAFQLESETMKPSETKACTNVMIVLTDNHHACMSGAPRIIKDRIRFLLKLSGSKQQNALSSQKILPN